MRKILLILSLLFIAMSGFSQDNRNLLINNYSRADVAKYSDYNFDWIKYPSYHDRTAWDKISGSKRAATIAEGEKYLGYDWPNILPTMYLEFSRTGNRNVIDSAISKRLSVLRSLFFAELMEGKGRFIDDIVNGLFTYFDQTYWGMSATFYLYEYGDSQSHPKTKLPDDTNPVIDLSVGDVASTISWIWYYLHEEFDKISPVINKRLIKEMREKVLEPYYSRNDFWWITGWNSGNVNNWTPWCSYNVLTSILLLEPDPQKRLDGIYKSMRSVDLFINSYPADGGCSEGPSYWNVAVGHLHNYLTLLRNLSGGGIDVFQNEIIKEMGRYIYKLYIANGRNYVNFADAPAIINQNGIKILRYGQDISDPELVAFGAFLAEESDSESKPVSGNVGEALADLFTPLKEVTPKEILVADSYLPNLQVAIGRDVEDSKEGFFFAAKGGNNGEQHNHNDVGSFVLYYNSNPIFIDPGVGTYTRETFSADRYRIWTMQSGYHNLPIINGQMQEAGTNYAASKSSFKSTPQEVVFSTDISKAYPEEAGVSTWVRTYTLLRGKRFIIKDKYELKGTYGKTSTVFMTPLPCKVEQNGVLLSGKDFQLKLAYPSSIVSCDVEEVKIEDNRLSSVWGDKLYRIRFTLKGSGDKGDIKFEVKR